MSAALDELQAELQRTAVLAEPFKTRILALTMRAMEEAYQNGKEAQKKEIGRGRFTKREVLRQLRYERSLSPKDPDEFYTGRNDALKWAEEMVRSL